MIAPAYKPVPQRFEFVREWDDRFLALFPHRGDYLWAEHPEPKKRPEWKTESTHLLTDRMIQKGEYLYGVRFGATTQYLLTDVDARSAYHPNKDPLAIARLLEALEPLGLVECIIVRSSDSGGLHLYFPFEEAVLSWAIALVAKSLLEGKGFKLRGGQLEIFPNPKPATESPINYNGHRLPLQQGSYLLNKDWEPIFSSHHAFVQQWQFAARRNQVSASEVERLAKSVQRKSYGKRIRTRGRKYLTDLNNDIEPGWTSSGQTQFLLGKIANRERVFYHALFGGEPLEGQALADQIAEVAQSLPGYLDFCRHQHEIHKKAAEWARAAEGRYYPYPSTSKKLMQQPLEEHSGDSKPSWNEQQSQAAKDRIRRAVADQLEKGTLPVQATERKKVLRSYRIGNVTLDKYRDLWHPKEVKPLLDKKYHPLEGDSDNSESLKLLQDKECHPTNTNKLVPDLAPALSVQEAGRVFDPAVGGAGGFSTGESATEDVPSPLNTSHTGEAEVSLAGPALVRQILAQIATKSQQFKQTRSNDLLPPDERYFRSKGKQLELLSESLSSSPSSKASSPPNVLLNGSAVSEHDSGDSENGSAVAVHSNSKDVGDVIAQVQVQFQRLGWTPAQAKSWIAEQFGGRSRWQLTDAELVDLLRKLQTCT